MTESENIDSTQSTENVTVTSDGAFERVTSDIKMEEWEDSWFLKQNTAWLVQEIPNISFLDISDTLLESNKTLHGKENWIVRVWLNAKSIETQPQDTVTLTLTSNVTYTSFPAAVHFDTSKSSLNNTVCEIDPDDTWKINILEDWYYRISYWWTINPWNATYFTIWVWTSNSYVTADVFDSWSYGSQLSWGRTISNVYLQKWDYVFMDILSNYNITVYKNYTYLDIQFQQYKL